MTSGRLKDDSEHSESIKQAFREHSEGTQRYLRAIREKESNQTSSYRRSLKYFVLFWCISPLGWTIASLHTETGATLQKPDRYNLRFLTETNFIKLKRVKWPQNSKTTRFKQTFITKLHLYQIFLFLEIFLIQLLGNPNWKLFQFIFQTETLFLLLDRVSFCGRGHSITTLF